MTRRTAALALLGALLLAASPESPSLYLPAEQQKEWADELALAQQRVERAAVRLERAEATYTEARHDQYPRGDALAEIEAELAHARVEQVAARNAMQSLIEEAREAGVLPGVLRPYE